MATLSSLHQLFNTDQCQASSHTLRWQERARQCPRCQSQDSEPWGTYHYRPGGQRSWCNGCQRPCNDRTAPLLQRSKRSLPPWMRAPFLLCLACASRRMARERGVQRRTRYRWCWWRRNAAGSDDTDRRLEGTGAAADLAHTAGNQGQAPGGGTQAVGRRPRGRRKKREPGRGHDDTDRPALRAWVRRPGSVGSQAPRDFTVQTVQKAADRAVHTGRRLSTAAASS
jgi:hypothetical protein